MRIKHYVTLLVVVSAFCGMAETPAFCDSEKATTQVVHAYQGLVENHERHARSRWISKSTENGESVSVYEGAPAERYKEDDPIRQSLWRAYYGITLGVKRNPYDALETGSIQKARKVDCECGTDCKCPPLVCKAGNCKANFVTMFSATWCRPCQKMYPILKELREEGYIVYIYTLDTKEFEDLNLDSKFQIRAYPTFLFFDKGKETHRMVGFSKKDKFYPHLVKEKDQDIKEPQPTPDPDVYDDL